MTDLVVISLESWDDVWRRNQHLIAGLLRRSAVRKVLVVEPTVDHVHELANGRLPARGNMGLRHIGIEGVGDGRLLALRQWKVLPRRVDPGGDRRRARAIVRHALAHGLKDPVLWVNDPGGQAVLRQTGWRSLYDITDDWLAAERPPRELDRIRMQEQDLLRRCDAVIACSPKLTEKGAGKRPVDLVPNAVDLDAYEVPWPRPAHLPHGPVTMYVGTLHRDRLDVDLTTDLARHLRGLASVVLVGPVALDDADISELSEAGVHVLGSVPSNAVPSYLQHADVLIVPHVVTPFTESLDPIKAYEYKAAGRPVVASDVPGFREDKSGQVRIRQGPAFAVEVENLIRAALPTVQADDVPDWGRRVDAFEEILERVRR